jgi:hypothetical protein
MKLHNIEYTEFIQKMLCKEATKNARKHAQLIHGACGLLLEFEEYEYEVMINSSIEMQLDEASDVEFFISLLECELGIENAVCTLPLPLSSLTNSILDTSVKYVFQNRKTMERMLFTNVSEFSVAWGKHIKECYNITRDELKEINYNKLTNRHKGMEFNQKVSDERDVL